MFAACALLHHQGRPVATLLYFVASLAVVYGILVLLSLPLRLAVLGTCPETGACTLGLEKPITSGENTALGFSIGMGIVAILAGFSGLRTQYRHHRARRQAAAATAATPSTRPARRIPPVGTKPQPQTTTDATASETPAAVEAPAAAEPQAELPSHEPDLELPAHVTESASEAGRATPAPASPRDSRRQRKPKAPPEPPASPNTE